MRSLVLTALLAALAPAAALAQRPNRAVPAVPKAPKLDGNLKDLPTTLALKPTAPGASASFTGRAVWRKDTLFIGVEATDDQLQAGDTLTLSLFFPDAGPLASGNVFRFGFDGKRPPPADSTTPALAQRLVEVGVQRKDTTLTFEVAVPVRALPRMPAQDALLLDLCLTYEDSDASGTQSLSNCKDGGMVGEVLRLPDEVRKNLKLKLPESVLTLEPRQEGWLGYDVFHYPAFVEADKPLTPELLKTLVVTQPVDEDAAGVSVPDTLSLPSGADLLVVLSGESPYVDQNTCASDKELRIGLYSVKGRTAQRALEWPAAACALGRANSMVLDEQGTLSIGYSNGPIVNFAWSGDHFERTELGKR